MLGVFACSTSVIFIKKSALDAALLSSLRLLVAAVLLFPLFLRARAQHRERWQWSEVRRCVVPALVLAVHFVSWAIGARGTLAANASLIVNMVPLATPFFLFALLGERVRRAELAGTALGLTGVVVLSAGDVRASSHYMAGDLTCFASMLLFALYLTLGRRNRDVPSLWLYVVPLYAIAGALCLVPGLLRGGFGAFSAREGLYVAGLAVVPTVVGHSLLNLALKQLPGATVSVCNLAQFAFAGALAWALFGEIPKPAFWPACALIVAGAATALRPQPIAPQPIPARPIAPRPIAPPAIKPGSITNPAITNPAITDPAITDPAITDPAITDPAITDPAITFRSSSSLRYSRPRRSDGGETVPRPRRSDGGETAPRPRRSDGGETAPQTRAESFRVGWSVGSGCACSGSFPNPRNVGGATIHLTEQDARDFINAPSIPIWPPAWRNWSLQAGPPRMNRSIPFGHGRRDPCVQPETSLTL
jgi:drug/metabolite transporter (DMT)-like permease